LFRNKKSTCKELPVVI